MEYLICAVFTILLFAKSISYLPVIDDTVQIYQVQNIYLKDKRLLITDPLGRLFKLFYGAGIVKNRKLDRLITLVLNVVIACLLCHVFNIWMSLLWIAHPMHNQVTLWMNGRRYQISLILGLIAVKYVLVGFLVYPLALFFHPVSAPFVLFAMLLTSPWALLWLAPAAFNYKWLYKWYRSRVNIQNFKQYQQFKPRNIILATKCLKDYLLGGVFTFNFNMYHPDLWGLAIVKYTKEKAYKANTEFYLSIGIIAAFHTLVAFLHPDNMMWSIVWFASLFQWLNIFRSPVQIWAQRYSIVGNIALLMIVINSLSIIPSPFNMVALFMYLTAFVIITLKDMPMYRDLYSYYEKHMSNDPYNENVHYYAMRCYENHEIIADKEGNKAQAVTNCILSMSAGLRYVLRNKEGIVLKLTDDKIKRVFGKQGE